MMREQKSDLNNNNNNNININNDNNNNKKSIYSLDKNAIIATTISGLGTKLAATGLIKTIGFTQLGILKGSSAALWMSKAAIASGGGITSGTTVSVLQSVGVLGFSVPVVLCTVAVGAGIGYGGYYSYHRWVKSKL